ncbi:membrane integrity-associated transporter subunit PqiC [Campylobacter sp. RM9344]|uniref:Type IV secretion system putative lipoprotein virB7 n=1 Tax=Campylobacter californiensis TaxID=1032243 RepID=A0AAW3ZVJ8_9BACT|nr:MULTISPECIES: lipoprotein [unclassified Campylobacter]MBE2984336.1 membrane integrity-associated transporter subunit PqiC [Campylobacter sp. RM6883]MBE2985910.1 membrane integrity-associated transporter subunit PqiC [Campylobacter sp. RM12919]MBE2988111.1 membrane integrity-associated transporter subunit PqiC [Campylobacter sp. RM12920]MBE2994797.1 membrane integrity-associated transporter subunit PqiC [Campylobacter sp. RM6913]MBE3021430.1 membrane integrity-associated transporter subunit 
MRKFTLALVSLIILSGCSIKTTVAQPDMYEIYYSNKECRAVKNASKNIYIDSVSALDLVDSRRILIVAENNKIRYLDDAKFVAMPSEMIYKALVKGVYSNCGLSPVFAPGTNDSRLKVNLISLQIRGDKAEVTMAYELFNASRSIKSGIINKELFCPDPSSKTVFETINKTVNIAIDTLLSEIVID